MDMQVIKQTGFTLVEVIIAVAIIGILAAIAYPSYQKYNIDTRRGDVKSDLIDIAGNIEKYGLANGSASYSDITLAKMGYSNAKLPTTGNELYNISLTSPMTHSWTLTATPIPDSLMDGDGDLVINYRGQTCWSQGASCTPSDSTDWDDK